jgi:phosphoenolpyruvate synthase/pyruvate phosphate dikinase
VSAPGYTRPLADLRRSDAAEFGGKSANLGDLISAGVAVPPGFAVSARAFGAFVESTGLKGMIAAALSRVTSGDVEAINAAAKTIGEAMRFAPLPDGVRDELVRYHDELARATGGNPPPVAVRSSALGEDSEEATHAGQQESFLWVRGVEQICDAVRDCWVSLYTPHAIGYRAALRAAEADPAMGVTVQLMVDAEVSGVMFTCNPVSGDPSMVALNASWGLGIAVVSGELTPDDYLVSKVTGEVVRRTVSEKHIEYVPEPAGRGTVRLEVDAERRVAPCLGEAELAALLEVARRVERHFGSHQDIEWAIARGRELPDALLVLQSRPVTGLAKPAPELSASAMSLVMSTFGASPQTAKRSGSAHAAE